MNFVNVYTTIALLAIAVSHGVHAEDTPKARLATITAVLTNVSSSINNLGIVVQAFPGGLAAVEPLLDGVSNTLAALEAGIAIATAFNPPLDIVGTLFLVQPAEHLVDEVRTAAKSLVDKKMLFDESDLSPIVLTQLEDLKNGSSVLTTVVRRKIPGKASPIVDKLIGPVNTTLDQSLAIFAGNASVDTFTGRALILVANVRMAALAIVVATVFMLL